jgi:arabinan endo-1,5-alpha-L-arabinosidase
MKVSAVMKLRHWLLVIVVLLAGSGLTQEEKIYTNPVIEPVAADPSVIRAKDGTFYLYATQDDWGDRVWRLIPIFRSRDLVNWTFVGDVFQRPPAWKEAGGFLWAPDISPENNAQVNG